MHIKQQLCFLLVLVVVAKEVRTIKLYHYTNKSGADEIRKSGYFRKSTSNDGDAIFGPGVYLTELSPLTGATRGEIALNNWHDASYTRKTKYFYELDMSSYDVIKQTTNRNIYVYPGKDLNLCVTNEWTLYNWTSNTPTKVDTSAIRTTRAIDTTNAIDTCATLGIGVVYKGNLMIVVATVLITVFEYV